jgi:hypothetical protein
MTETNYTQILMTARRGFTSPSCYLVRIPVLRTADCGPEPVLDRIGIPATKQPFARCGNSLAAC